MKRNLLFLLFVCLCATSTAQTIKGIVNDGEGAPIGYATVVLCSPSDTTQLDYTVTADDGRFSFNTPAVGQLLHVSFVGYTPQYVTASHNMIIILEQDAVAIGEVVVKGSRPISKITTQGVQTTVANTVLSDMGTGNDVLKRIPMVEGDDGAFKVFGRGDATIYINNREVRDPSELDNLNSSDIQSIEVVSNPGARYDASVKAVINIKTIKKQGDGFSFNARSSLHAGENEDYINQINTNYRKGGLDIFANFHHSDITSIQRGDIYQTTTVDTLWQQNSYLYGDRHNIGLNATLGANFEISEEHLVGFRYDHSTTPKNGTSVLELQSDVYADGVLFDKWDNSVLTDSWKNIDSEANLYYSGKVEDLSIDFNADYTQLGYESNDINTEYSSADGERVLNSYSRVENELWATKLLLSHPLFGGNLSFGGEYVDITRGDEYTNEDLAGFSSNVDIAEQNAALFSQYSIESKVGSFAAGLRFESAKYSYLVDNVEDSNKSREYAQWFPNFSYSNEFGELNLKLNYDSKVTRPSYRALSNNLTYGNRLTLETGNPYLKPSISQSLSLVGVWKYLQTYVSYTHEKDAIEQWIDRYELDPKVSIINYRNIDEVPSLAAFITASPVFGWYKPSARLGLSKYWIDHSAYGVEMDSNDPFLQASLDNIFELPHDITINLDASFRSKGHYLFTYLYQNSFKLNFGVAKSFFDKSLQVRVNLYNITNQSEANMFITPQNTLKNLYHFDNREVAITVRYYFNAARSKYKGSGAGQSAKSRF